MKKLILILLLGAGISSAQADGYRYYHHRSYSRPSFSFYLGGYPYYGSYYTPGYSYSYPYYPSYYPGYGYAYTRPNYAVSGTLFGALAGGLIGDSIHHQGWEGAGIGAAAGLLLGGLAEHGARVQERGYYAPAPAVSYGQPAYIPNAPTVNTAPTIPDPPRVPPAPAMSYSPANAMSSANSLFGR